jgi:hypothetical protein
MCVWEQLRIGSEGGNSKDVLQSEVAIDKIGVDDGSREAVLESVLHCSTLRKNNFLRIEIMQNTPLLYDVQYLRINVAVLTELLKSLRLCHFEVAYF